LNCLTDSSAASCCTLHFTASVCDIPVLSSSCAYLHPSTENQSRAVLSRPNLRPFPGQLQVQSTAVLNQAHRAWKLKSSQWPGQRERDRPSPGRDVKSSHPQPALYHLPLPTALLCNTKSTQQTQHIIAPLRPTRPPHASRCATCCAQPEHCIRCPSTPTPSVAAESPHRSLPTRHRSLPPPSLARASQQPTDPSLRERID
jgi:hypothetical protein